MIDPLHIALLAGSFALGSSLITGLLLFLRSQKRLDQKLEESHRHAALLQEEVLAFQLLEDRYIAALATDAKPAREWRRSIRKQMQTNGFKPPCYTPLDLRYGRRMQDCLD